MITSEITQKLEAAPQGLVSVWPFPGANNPRAFLSGDPESDRIRIRYFRDPSKPELWGRAWFGPGSEGPPGLAHGGGQAAILDEAMGGCAWMNGHTVVAARFTVELEAPVPLGTLILFRAEIVRVEGRKIFAKAELLREDRSSTYCRGEGLFIVIDPGTFLQKRKETP